MVFDQSYHELNRLPGARLDPKNRIDNSCLKKVVVSLNFICNGEYLNVFFGGYNNGCLADRFTAVVDQLKSLLEVNSKLYVLTQAAHSSLTV